MIRACFFFAITSLTIVFSSTAQNTSNVVIAQQGDGIFSILRSAGIPPVKYYVDFLELNKDQIKGASELAVGKKYILPYAPDSFKNMGVLVDMYAKEELPIFKTELAQMKLKDSTLKNTVYYIIYDSSKIKNKGEKSADGIMGQLANDLMIRGSRVYLMPKMQMLETNVSEEENTQQSIAELGNFTSVVNKKYLKHKGSYQRVLVISGNEEIENGISAMLQHYEKSEEGQKLAENLRKTFKKSSRKIVKSTQGISIFKDDINVYMAKNIIPSVTTIYLKANSDAIQLSYSKSILAKLLTQGIIKDYSSLKASK